MVQVASLKSGHLKLKIFLGVIALLVAGYFVYKYSYIYLERRKYNKATVVIQKVADDLRAQGVQTTPYTECTRAQAKFNTGSISCYTGIAYKGEDDKIVIKVTLENFIKAITLQDFSLKDSGGLNPSSTPIIQNTSSYTMKNSTLNCGLTYSKEDDLLSQYDLTFECGKSSKFKLF